LENEFERDLLVVSDSVWKIGAFNYAISVGDNNTFDVALTLDSTGGKGCCSNRLFVKTLEIDGNLKDLENFPPIVTVFLD